MSDGRKFYGKYRGIVSDIEDPLMTGRIKARVKDVYGDDESGWAMPCAPFSGSEVGLYALPKKGAGVWIEFEHGDPEYPIWSGGWWGSVAEMPKALLAPPYKKVMLITEGGNKITLDDTPGVGGITLETSGGQKLKLSSTGCELDNGTGGKISMTGPNVSVNNGALEIT